MTDDPLAHVHAGDAWPLSAPVRLVGEAVCTETAGRALGNVCMRAHGHPGQHIDVDGGEVIATWPRAETRQ